MRKLLLPVFIAACIPSYAQSVIGFEGGVPEGFTSSQSELSVTSNLYKEGKQSLEWNFGPESTLEIALKKPIVLNKKSETKGEPRCGCTTSSRHRILSVLSFWMRPERSVTGLPIAWHRRMARVLDRV